MFKIAGNVLVTGAAGFIGSALSKRLAELGCNVVGYDNLSAGRNPMLDSVGGNFNLVNADISDVERIKSAVRDNSIETVFHLAANPDVRIGIKNTRVDLDSGIIGTYNVLEAMREGGAKNIVFTSSSTVYGNAEVQPTPESHGPLKPVSLYGAAKLAAEAKITAHSHLFGYNYMIFRLANVIGPTSGHGIIFDLIGKLKRDPTRLEVLGDGKQKKSYIEIDDCVGAMLHVCSNAESNDIYNIGIEDQITAGEIAEAVRDRFSPKAEIVYTGGQVGWPGDIPNFLLSVDKLKRTGYSFRCRSSREAVLSTIGRL
ncbi:MAG: SDR family NAD(P)-dependent oxidoreductase [Candidatus Micrarchaeota archaeon]|nr:SDR family NAD(P)-dependent oxidoreductase [Candidatus Micrarchaeota archaeon]